MLALDRQRQLSRATADVAVTLGRKAEETGWTSGMMSMGSQLHLPGLAIPSAREIVLMAFKNFGILMSGIIGVITLALLITWCTGFFCRVRGLPFHPEATRMAHTLVAVVPSLGPYLRRHHHRY